MSFGCVVERLQHASEAALRRCDSAGFRLCRSASAARADHTFARDHRAFLAIGDCNRQTRMQSLGALYYRKVTAAARSSSACHGPPQQVHLSARDKWEYVGRADRGETCSVFRSRRHPHGCRRFSRPAPIGRLRPSDSGRTRHEGEVICLDGNTGHVYRGCPALAEERPEAHRERTLVLNGPPRRGLQT